MAAGGAYAVALEAVTRELARPGGVGVGVDDGGTRGEQLPRAILVPDYHLRAGVVVRGEDYPAVIACAAEVVQRAGGAVTELHATEIVNPGARSPWRAVPFETRLEVYRAWAECLERAVQRIPYVYVAAEQYAGFLARAAALGATMPERQEEGLQRVFYRCLGPWLQTEFAGEPVVVQDEPSYGPDLGKGLGFWGDAVVVAPSEALPLVQLADLAAYTVNRWYHIKGRAQRDPHAVASPFDEVTVDLLIKTTTRRCHLLDHV